MHIVKLFLNIAYIVGYVYLYMVLASLGLVWFLLLITYCGFIVYFFIASRKKKFNFYKITWRFTCLYALIVIVKLLYLPVWFYFVGLTIIMLAFFGLLKFKFIIHPVKAYRYLLCKFDLWLLEVQVMGASQVIKDKEDLNQYLIDKKLLYYIEIHKKRVEVFENDGFKYNAI